MEFNVDSFESHREQLLQMQRAQQEQLLREETDVAIPGGSGSMLNLKHSLSSQPTSRFTLDSARAQFAASAVCNSAQDLIQSVAAVVPPTVGSVAVGTANIKVEIDDGGSVAVSAAPNGPKVCKYFCDLLESVK